MSIPHSLTINDLEKRDRYLIDYFYHETSGKYNFPVDLIGLISEFGATIEKWDENLKADVISITYSYLASV